MTNSHWKKNFIEKKKCFWVKFFFSDKSTLKINVSGREKI